MHQIETERFGTLIRSEASVLDFPGGIFGFELHQTWVILADSEHGSLYWLQSTEQPDLSFAVVNPREFVEDYELRASAQQLKNLWRKPEPLIVLSMLTYFDEGLVLNLRNPILINAKLFAGRQIVVSDGSPMQLRLPAQTSWLRRSA